MQHPIYRRDVRPRRTFRDAALQQEFASAGYVVVPLLSAGNSRALTELFRSLKPDMDTGFYNIMFSNDSAYREQVSAGVTEVMQPLVTSLLDDYRPLVGTYMVKLPGPESELAAHQDWNLVDEEHFVSVNVWAPVTPLTDDNGALYVMPGSHLFMDGLRPSAYCRTCLDEHRTLVQEKYLRRVVVPEGYAVIHNNAVVHGSSANQSSDPRVVANLTMIPREARPIHYYLDPATGDVDYFEVDARFYMQHALGQRPNYPVKDTIVGYQSPTVSAAALSQLAEGHSR